MNRYEYIPFDLFVSRLWNEYKLIDIEHYYNELWC